MAMTKIPTNHWFPAGVDAASEALPGAASEALPGAATGRRKRGSHGGHAPLTRQMLELAKLTRELKQLEEKRRQMLQRFTELKREVDRELASIQPG